MRLARKMRLVGGTRAIKATFSKPFMWHLYFHYSSNAGARTDNLVHGMALPEQVPSGSLRTSRSNRSTARSRDNHPRDVVVPVDRQLRKKPRKCMVAATAGQRSLASVLRGKLIHYIGAKLKVPDKPAALRYFRMRGSILTSFLLYDPQAPNCSFTSTVRPRYFQAIGDANGCR